MENINHSTHSTSYNSFKETQFHLLMQKRVTEILLVSSKYDRFMLEEDGRIEEQMFEEYASLSIRYPPRFTHVSSASEAFQILETKYFELIITMLNLKDSDAFELAKDIKKKYPNKPIVVLTHFSREVSMKLKKEDLSSIDYVFSWLGNSKILLAIVKLIEDKLNSEYDITVVGVQTILLVEDSIRYYSSYLTLIYRILFQQAKEIMAEGLNEHQQTMRMRARPKIMLANNYDDAVEYYEKYKSNILGVITDVSFKRAGKRDELAGIKLCKFIRESNKELPIIVQSSSEEHREDAYRFNARFVYKNSNTLTKDIRDYIRNDFGFGPLKFLDPKTMKEINRATDLKSLQKKLGEIPLDSLEYHISKNHFSKWLTAKALFNISSMIIDKKQSDFNNLEEIRTYIIDTIKAYRLYRNRGTIARFNIDKFDEYTMFARIGTGSLGGKARGLAFLNTIIKSNKLTYNFDNVLITIPRTVVLTTEVFDEFMEENDLYEMAYSDASDEDIHAKFLNSNIPKRFFPELYAYLAVIKRPLAIRSSSLMEDSHYQPFAGVYATYMIPNNKKDIFNRFTELSNAIKSVYASTFYKSSKDYIKATKNVIDEEKMAVILQEVTGRSYKNEEKEKSYYYPTFSGVARSLNFYPIGKEKAEEGIVNVALGLGKTIVEGEVSLRFSPKHPKKIIQLSNPEMALKSTQNTFYSLNLDKNIDFIPDVNEAYNLLKLDLVDAEGDLSIKHLASTYDYQNEVLRDGTFYKGRRVITFANILKHHVFPLPEILSILLKIGSDEMNAPIELEFAVELNPSDISLQKFHVLQIRPIVEGFESDEISLEDLDVEKDTIIYAKTALGNGIYDDLYDFVYIKPESFDPKNNEEIATLVGEINKKFIQEKRNYILVGPGRWGSSDPWLGIPIKWTDISEARVIVESGLKDYRIDASQGSHFFQNLTSFKIAYLTINPFINDGYYNIDYLNKEKVYFENDYIRHIRFKKPVIVKINGKDSEAAIFK